MVNKAWEGKEVKVWINSMGYELRNLRKVGSGWMADIKFSHA
jgi:hypothetical protein